MLFTSKNKKNDKLALLNCITGEISQSTSLPTKLGSTENCTLKATSGEEVLEIDINESGNFFIKNLSENTILLNAKVLEEGIQIEETEATLQIGNDLYIIFFGKNSLARAEGVDINKWYIFDVLSSRIEDEVIFSSIKKSVLKRGLTGSGLALSPKGASLGFYYNQVFNIETDELEAISANPTISYDAKAITCPMCWLKFDIGDAMNIATDENLRGDPILGEDEMLRFLPVSFGTGAVALDPSGLPAPDIACPHCRRKLPPNFLDLDLKIFSIVGAPSSGKSYYLSVLIKELKDALIKNFGINFKDLDPSGNMVLTTMKNKLFSADTPESAILAKTAFEGAMYEKYPRFGKMVALPKPLTYSIESLNEDKNTAMVFYDNAGEHFEPGLDLEDSPGAMHVASSSAIFFLFDPASNRSFKEKLTNHPDPQLKIRDRIDQQDTILSEMEVRIKRIVNLDSSAKIEQPLALIINKYDIWKDLLDEDLESYYKDSKLDLGAVDRNSDRIKAFMLKTEPAIVATAQSLSSNLKYFAISPLGHTPIKIEEGQCQGMIAPDPVKIKPLFVEIPTIWALSKTTENLIPTTK
ncbi:MAG: hypothetical protein R3Y46_03170 [Opitutales bacterium]